MSYIHFGYIAKKTTMKKIILKHKKEAPITRFHPWVFSGAVHKMEGQPKDGDLVEVFSSKDQYLATGHYQNGSICVRIISFEQAEANQEFWKKKLEKAYQYRQRLGLISSEVTNCYRLIHAEGDGCPGLIIDVYDTTGVLQCHSIGMFKQKKVIAEALLEVYGEQLTAIYNKSSEVLPKNFGRGVENHYLYGDSSTAVVLENKHQFHINWETGQKTGFFLDQRDNRDLLTRYVANKSVLNAFCYSGGFSIYALNAGAKLVHSVDISEKAIDLTEENVALNANETAVHESYAMDVLKFLQESTTSYEVMVVDPPAYAKSMKKRHNAIQGYKRLNALALKKIAPGGILFTFSCSQVVDKQLFYNTIVAAAIEAKRQVKVMQHLSQPADHPVSLFHPEGSYLKGLVLYVE